MIWMVRKALSTRALMLDLTAGAQIESSNKGKAIYGGCMRPHKNYITKSIL
jgi:hypothetical protein